MSDSQWADQETVQKKKAIPTWAWFCGGGCLLLVLVLVIGGVFTARAFKGMMDPEEQWPKLEKILPFEERPQNLDMVFGMNILGQTQQYTLLDSRGFTAVIQSVSGPQGANMRKQMFDAEEPKLVGNMGMLDFENAQKTTIDVQGRDLRVVRLEMALGEMMQLIPGVEEDMEESGGGHMAYVDLTEEGDSGMMWLQYTRRGGDGGPITDDDIRAFFEPFQVGPNR